MKKRNEKTAISCGFGRVVLMKKDIVREYVRDESSNTVKMSQGNRQGKLDVNTRRVFRELAKMILLGLGGDD